MQRVLVVGIETIVGGNLAKSLSQHHQVVGLSATKNIQIAGCHIHEADPQTPEAVHRELVMHSPDLVIVCGPAAETIWSSPVIETARLEAVGHWARETAKTNARLIVISSDAVFHGPWMFHEEDCTGVCQSPAAIAIRKMEAQVARACPSALIVRTNAFGWSPRPGGGWLETLIEQISKESPLRVPAANYATPIEGSQLAGILLKLWHRGLEGVYHAGGSERVNFVHFAHRLAQELGLPRPRFLKVESPEASHVFGQGETSLSSAKVRRAVGAPLPMLSESLKSLREQSETGERDLLGTDAPEFSHAA